MLILFWGLVFYVLLVLIWNCIAFSMSGGTQTLLINTSKVFYLLVLEPLVCTWRYSSHHGFYQQCWKKTKSSRNLQWILFKRTTCKQRKWFLKQYYHQSEHMFMSHRSDTLALPCEFVALHLPNFFYLNMCCMKTILAVLLGLIIICKILLTFNPVSHKVF